tara:strand:+ start:82 stop:453 length:372 start_codon:yes stop_codon:yes gene_type:complete
MEMDKVEKKIQEYAEMIRKQSVELLQDIEVEVMPYVEEDTIANAMIQAQDIVKAILEGRFKWDGDYIVIHGVRELTPRLLMKFSQSKWDSMRDNLIERMPACPKDAKIAALEEELQLAYRRNY